MRGVDGKGTLRGTKCSQKPGRNLEGVNVGEMDNGSGKEGIVGGPIMRSLHFWSGCSALIIQRDIINS